MQSIFRYSVSDERKLGQGISAYLATLANQPARWTLIEWYPSIADAGILQTRFLELINNKAFEGFIYRQKLYVVIPEQANVEATLAELQKHGLFMSPGGATAVVPERAGPRQPPEPAVAPAGAVDENPGLQLNIQAHAHSGPWRSIIACGLITGAVTVYWFGYPRIEQISAEPRAIEIGDTAILNWAVRGATQVYLYEAGGSSGTSLPRSGQRALSLLESMTYRLVANGWLGMKAERTIEVVVHPHQLQIGYFRAIANPGTGTQPIRVSWQVMGAKRVEITPGFGVVGRVGSEPANAEIVYTLKATGPDGQILVETLNTREWDGTARLSTRR